MTTLWQDIRYGFRTLAGNPGFAIVVVVILSLGIAANTAVFSVVNAVLFKRMPYADADRIVVLNEQRLQQGLRRIASSHHTLSYWREHNEVFESIAGMEGRRFYATGMQKPQHVVAFAVSPGYFSVMGMKPMLGREFMAEEEKPGNGRVTMLSFAFWREQMSGDPQVIGKSLTLDGEGYTIVGVMPAAFRDHLRRCAPCWVPLTMNPTDMGGGTSVRARLKPGVTLAQAQAHMDVLEAQFAKAESGDKAGFTVEIQRFLDNQVGDSRALLYLLWGGVGLLLLIACANASGLFLIQSSGRQQEIAVRSALGASRGRIIRLMLTEGVILSATAGVIGMLLAHLAIKVLVRVSPVHIPRMQDTRMDMPVLCFVFGVSIVAGLALSLLPAWKTTGMRLSEILKQGRGGLLHGHGRRRAHGVLVVVQIAVASTLLMAVAMLTRSLMAMQEVDLGFEPAGVLVAEMELPKMKYPEPNDWLGFYSQLLHDVQAAPGVQSAALVSGPLNLAGGGGFTPFVVDGRPADVDEKPMARFESVSPDFFRTMGIPILEGRSFTTEDAQPGGGAIIVDENLARKYFPKGSAVGQRINGMPIVGVASTLKDYGELAPGINTIYTPISGFCFLMSGIVVRTQGDPMRLADMVRARVANLDKDLEIRSLRTLSSDLTEMLSPRRYTTLLLGLFAQVALILAAVGLFGLLRYLVAQRTREIGIRMALGATQADITRSFLRRSLGLIGLGLAAGLLGGYIVSRLMGSLLYEASATDPVMLLVTLSILVTTALVASYLPARRAARIDPMTALRCE